MHKVNKKTILRGHKKRKKIKQLSSLDLNSDLARDYNVDVDVDCGRS